MATEGQGTRMRVVESRWITTGGICAFVALLFLSGHIDTYVGRNSSFLPALLALLTTVQALTGLFLFQKFLSGGRGGLVGIASAYLASAPLTVVYALAVPGVITQRGPLALNPSMSTWFWVANHASFPFLVLVALLTARWAERWTVTQARRRALVALYLGACLAWSAAVIAVVLAFHSSLPVVRTDISYAALRHYCGWFLFIVNALAVVFCFARIRTVTGTLAWVPVAAVSSLADTTLTLFSGTRYTVGWYAGRSLSLLTEFIVLAAIMAELFRLYRQSEQHRRELEDEALDLLRENRAALYREDRVRRVIENAADAYIEINRDGEIQAWNGKASELFGWTSEDVQNKQFVEVVMAHEGWTQFRALIDEFWTSEDRFDGSYAELLVISGDGREFPAEATLWVDESDFEPRMSFFLRDITVRRETQERLQKALYEEREAVLRLQEIDRVKNNFVSTVSHELRSPLTNTLGYLELLADGDGGELTESQLHMVMVAQRNAQRLFSLIEDLLILSRVEEGAFSVRFRAIAMNDVLNVVASNNANIAAERNVALTFDIDETLGVCPGDAKQLTRALSNVVNNAVKFSDGGSSVHVTAHQSADEIELQIEDNGIGIPHDEQPKLFERFYRTSISVEAQHQGAGLGLTITKAIIDHHGGSIDIASELGKGTKVTIRLPAMQTVDATVGEVAPA